MIIGLKLHKRYTYQNRDWLYQKYAVEELTMTDISLLVDVSITTIERQLIKFSIKSRGYVKSKETKEKLSKARKGYKCSDEYKQNMSKIKKGKRFNLTKEQRIKWSKIHSGEKSNFWKGGITSENKRLRMTFEQREWRKAVYERDNYTCQECNKRGGILNAHHIMPFSTHPMLRTELSNGITLCQSCHNKKKKPSLNICNKS
jgi:hypothetical protein